MSRICSLASTCPKPSQAPSCLAVHRDLHLWLSHVESILLQCSAWCFCWLFSSAARSQLLDTILQIYISRTLQNGSQFCQWCSVEDVETLAAQSTYMLKPLSTGLSTGLQKKYIMPEVYEAQDDCRGGLEDLVLSAREIQKILQFTTHADLLNLLVMHGDGTCTLLHVTFDHTKLNGIDVCRILKKHSKDIMDIFFAEASCGYWQDQCHKHILVRRKVPVPHQIPRVVGLSSMQEALGAHIFQGPHPILTVREIYREIFRLFAADFFMCIDISHLFAGEPCMLRISYYWNQDFDEQWNEMIALKKSRDLAICSWRCHLEKQELWASHLPHLCSDFLPLYGSGMENTYPLETAEVTSISAVAFSLSADQSDCFFTIYPAEPAGESHMPSTREQCRRFQNFRQIFQLEPSQLRVRPNPKLADPSRPHSKVPADTAIAARL